MMFWLLNPISTHHDVVGAELLAGILLLFSLRWIYELFMELYKFIYWIFYEFLWIIHTGDWIL